MGDKKDLFYRNMGKNRELLIALKILGEGLKGKGYNKNKIIRLCRDVRKDVYNAEIRE